VGHHRPTNIDLAWPAIPHAAGRLPKSASDGHAARGWGMAVRRDATAEISQLRSGW